MALKIIIIALLGSFTCLLDIEENNLKLNQEKDYCSMIDTLLLERNTWKSGNYYSNRIIPILSTQSGISSNADKGTLGYMYREDSVFYSDINLWKDFFKCDN